MTLIPDPEKYTVLLEYARRYHLRHFIETGSADGDTTAALVPYMTRLITVELGHPNYLNVVLRFLDEPKVTVIHGDSDNVLERLLREDRGPFLYWLDAHDNGHGQGEAGPCPVLRELHHITARRERNCILIDDARCFGVEPGWPTIDEVKAAVGYAYDVEVLDDIIRCTPR